MNFKPLLILPPIALGVLGFMWMTQPDDTPTESPAEVRQAVRVMTAAPEPLLLTATGYGRVEAVQSWNAVSQVDGRITGLTQGLAVGTVIEAGTALIQIEPTDYELAVAKSEANIAVAEATLAELEQQDANSRRLLAIEQRVLEVAQAEFERTQSLFENGTASSAARDTAQKTLLAQENAVVNLTNTLALYPVQRASAEATLATRRAELAEAQRDLENTTMIAPFDGRISSEAVERDQFVRTGEELVVLNGIDQVEVVGAFQPQAFGTVVQSAIGPELQNATEVDATKVIDYLRSAGVEAFVELDIGDRQVRYSADLIRFRGTVESETGTIGLAVRVNDPLIARPDQLRPPLEIGSFVSVVLESSLAQDAISIPRTALRQDDAGQPFVYTADAENRLAITTVTPGTVAGDRIVIRDGLVQGDRVVLSTPRPAIAGLALTLIEDAGTDP